MTVATASSMPRPASGWSTWARRMTAGWGDSRMRPRPLAPILPSKVICIGKNYADHAREMGGEPPADPVMFLKPSTSVIGPGAAIKLPPDSTRVDFEGELAAVIGRPCRDVPAAQASSASSRRNESNSKRRGDSRSNCRATACPTRP